MTPAERQCFTDLLAKAPAGPRIEFGVFRGATLQLMTGHDGPTYGVDSFEGMAKPTPKDIKDGWNPYPECRLAAPPPNIPGAYLIKGFVPDVLPICPNGPYAFAHVDMDQFQPTWHVIPWLWERMLPGGIICCDDWFADRDWLAAGAINVLARFQPLTGTCGRKAWWTMP